MAPVAAALAAIGRRVAWVFVGSAAQRAAAILLGMPPDAAPAPPKESFAGALIAIAHADEGTLALAAAMATSGARILRVDAGARAFVDDRASRELDRRADFLLCATSLQRDNLRRDGIDVRRTLLAGCGLAAAAQRLISKRESRVVALLLHGKQDRDALRQAISLVAAARGLRVFDCGDLADLVGATAVVTDCDDAATFACALGAPCTTVAWQTARPETVACGANRIAGDEPRAVARALEIALDARGPFASPYVGGLTAESLRTLLAMPSVGTAAPELPSDGDFTGRTLGAEECESTARAIRSGTLNSTKGTFVATFEREFAAHIGSRHAIACSSGSAAVHAAIASLRLSAGDEVVTTPITDMGALACICYEGGVPVFADVDPRTMNVHADTIAAQLTDRTRAIIVTHLFGLVCEMEPILTLASARGIPVIEDCAQAFGATSSAGRAGSFGSIACFSLQQGKHMTTGEGGVVATDDADLARRMFLFVNKAWGYGDPAPDHYFPAPNARMTELQGAVALPQLRKLDWVIQNRRRVAAAITRLLLDVPGLRLPQDPDGGMHSWWKYAFFVDPRQIAGGAVALGARMKARGVFCAPRYVQKPAFECELFRDFDAHPVTRLPLEHNPRRSQAQPLFRRADYGGAVAALDSVIVLPIDELYEDRHVAIVCDVIRDEAKALSHG